MTCNVGKVDKVLRIVLGLVLIALGFVFNSWWGAIGIIPLATAGLGWCPLYLPLGVSTCAREK